ncbi:hypothetical protein BLOT_010075 [Blomia tropicalis]|nr:hypothetical protein BLOT_010075 [Blomia tropicalis]
MMMDISIGEWSKPYTYRINDRLVVCDLPTGGDRAAGVAGGDLFPMLSSFVMPFLQLDCFIGLARDVEMKMVELMVMARLNFTIVP